MWLAIWGMRVFPDIVGIEICYFVIPSFRMRYDFGGLFLVCFYI